MNNQSKSIQDFKPFLAKIYLDNPDRQTLVLRLKNHCKYPNQLSLVITIKEKNVHGDSEFIFPLENEVDSLTFLRDLKEQIHDRALEFLAKT